MSPFNNGTQVEKRDLKIGDVVKVSTTIDTRDIADPDSEAANRRVQSVLIDNETHHWSRIRAGESFGRYAVASESSIHRVFSLTNF